MRRSKSGLFLMEIMFAILFFSVASAVCLQLFAKAHTLSRDAIILDEAVTLCQSAASILEAEGADALSDRYENGQWQEDRFLVPFESENSCQLVVTQEETSYDIRALNTKNNTEIFSLQLLKKTS